MCEPLLTHEVVGLEGCVQVVQVDANRAAHEHVLGTLGDLAMNTEQVGSFKSLKTEEIVIKVAGVVDDFVDSLFVVLYDFVCLLRKEWRWPACLVSEVVKLVCHVKDTCMRAVVQSLY